MSQYCCSPYCEHWDECVALGIIKFKKIILERPWEVTKSWCPSLKYQVPQNIREESPST